LLKKKEQKKTIYRELIPATKLLTICMLVNMCTN